MTRRGITCDLCGEKGARIRRVTQSYGRGSGEFFVRNIPTISCPHCYQVYLTSKTLRELERIKVHHRSLAVKRRIAVAEFPAKPRRRAG